MFLTKMSRTKLWYLVFGVVFGIWSSYVLFYVFENTTSFWGAIFASFGTAIGPIIYMTSTSPIQNDQDVISNITANLSAEISLFVKNVDFKLLGWFEV